MFWVYRYKGFSFTAARTVHTALVLAGLKAHGETHVEHAELIDRGYDHLERQLTELGANIRRVSGEAME